MKNENIGVTAVTRGRQRRGHGDKNCGKGDILLELGDFQHILVNVLDWPCIYEIRLSNEML